PPSSTLFPYTTLFRSFDLMNICGEVVIGEGIKDDAPGIFKGEQLGTWLPGSPPFDIAIDPIDGTTNIAKGAPNSICCIAAASPRSEEHTSELQSRSDL